jgi:hypothetical protein
MSVIRNTNTKIILRLPDKSDRELVGYAAGLDEDQIEELSKLKRGVAAVYQNDWVEPVLVQVNKCTIPEIIYDCSEEVKKTDYNSVRTQIVKLLIQGRVSEKYTISLDEIEKGLDSLGLSTLNYEFVEEQIIEFKEKGELSIWKDDNFRKLSRRITDILGVRAKVENIVVTAMDNEELTEKLGRVVELCINSPSEPLKIALSQCFMKDMSTQQEEREMREKIYLNWFKSVVERSRGL